MSVAGNGLESPSREPVAVFVPVQDNTHLETPPQSRNLEQVGETTRERWSPSASNLSVHPSDYLNIQEEIDALTRLFEYYRERLRDEPHHANARLWKQEMMDVEAEITALGPTMFFVESKSHENEIIETESVEESTPETEPNVPTEKEEPADSAEFIDRALALWAESRKEALSGPTDQLSDSRVVLQSALQDVRALAQNVDEFPGMAKAQKPTRQAAIALVGMLEENVGLRLKLLGKTDNGGHQSEFNQHPIHQLKSTGGAGAGANHLPRKGSSPRIGADGVAIQDEEFEI
jgi:hypothetical protein